MSGSRGAASSPLAPADDAREAGGRGPGCLPMALVGLLLTLSLSELAVRVRGEGAVPRPRLFAEEDGRIVLQAQAESALRHPSGRVTRITTDAQGLRRGGLPGGWLVVGDSQVLGQGVEDAETFVALASSAGLKLANGGVTGHGVEDALERAARLAPRVGATGVMVVVNQLNDWDEVGLPAGRRMTVRGGFLVSRDKADSWAARSLDGPLAFSHLYLTLLALTRPPEVAAPARGLQAGAASGEETARICAAIKAFAADNPAIATLALLLPADIDVAPQRGARSSAWTPEPRSSTWPALREALRAGLGGLPSLDLAAVLVDRPDAFLDGDTHLSPLGHAAVAALLVKKLGESGAERGGPRLAPLGVQ